MLSKTLDLCSIGLGGFSFRILGIFSTSLGISGGLGCGCSLYRLLVGSKVLLSSMTGGLGMGRPAMLRVAAEVDVDCAVRRRRPRYPARACEMKDDRGDDGACQQGMRMSGIDKKFTKADNRPGWRQQWSSSAGTGAIGDGLRDDADVIDAGLPDGVDDRRRKCRRERSRRNGGKRPRCGFLSWAWILAPRSWTLTASLPR